MNKQILVEVSARHVHLSKEDFEKLYGKGNNLVPIKKLSQPGEFASEDTLILLNGKNKIENVRVLGPLRKKSQVEISLTDAYKLKLNPLPHIKISGDLENTTNITAKGSSSHVKLPVIIAQRHLHCSEKQARELKLKNNDKISIKINGEREITFHNIVVRVSDKYDLSLHIDTDEANAAGIKGKTYGNIVKDKYPFNR
jgi:putative phosphotransacetylase